MTRSLGLAVAALLCWAPVDAAAQERPYMIYGAVDGGTHQVITPWPLFEEGVATGTGESSGMVAFRAGGAWRRLPFLRAELGLALLPYSSTRGSSNMALLYALDVLVDVTPLSAALMGVTWTPMGIGGVGVYQNVRGDLGRDADFAFSFGGGLRGQLSERFAVRLTVLDYFTDYIKGEGPGNNLMLSAGIELAAVGAARYTPPTPLEPERIYVMPSSAHSDPSPEALEAQRAAAARESARERHQEQARSRARIEGAILLFELGAATVTDEHDISLQRVAAQLRAQPRVRLVVVGYADSRGSEEENVKLSQRRANAVVQRLGQLGVDSSRLLPAAAGEDVPFAENATDAERAENRRVELLVLSDFDPAVAN